MDVLGQIEVTRRRGRRRKKLLDDLYINVISLASLEVYRLFKYILSLQLRIFPSEFVYFCDNAGLNIQYSLNGGHPLFCLFIYLLCTMTNKCTIISQIITLLPHVSTLSCHPQGACNQYLVKSHKYVKCSSL